jgi:hypothetical protein
VAVVTMALTEVSRHGVAAVTPATSVAIGIGFLGGAAQLGAARGCHFGRWPTAFPKSARSPAAAPEAR